MPRKTAGSAARNVPQRKSEAKVSSTPPMTRATTVSCCQNMGMGRVPQYSRSVGNRALFSAASSRAVRCRKKSRGSFMRG